MPQTDTKPIVLGVIAGAHGVRGTVKIKSYTEYSDDLTAYGVLYNAQGDIVDVTIKGHNKDMILADIAGVNSREEAQALHGTELMVPRSALPDTNADAGEYYIEDLVGMAVELEDGTAYGTIKSIQNYGAGDVVELHIFQGNKALLLPFNDECFPRINTKKHSVILALPEYIEVTEEAAKAE